MIYSTEAAAQIEALQRHYRVGNRLEAVRDLAAAPAEAEARIERDPGAGLPAPRPYPGLAREGRAWTKAGRYWIAYSTTQPPVILGVFYETSISRAVCETVYVSRVTPRRRHNRVVRVAGLARNVRDSSRPSAGAAPRSFDPSATPRRCRARPPLKASGHSYAGGGPSAPAPGDPANTSSNTPSRTTTAPSSAIVVPITGKSKCPAV